MEVVRTVEEILMVFLGLKKEFQQARWEETGRVDKQEIKSLENLNPPPKVLKIVKVTLQTLKIQLMYNRTFKMRKNHFNPLKFSKTHLSAAFKNKIILKRWNIRL